MRNISIGIFMAALILMQIGKASAGQLKAETQNAQIAVINPQAFLDKNGLGTVSCTLKNIGEKTIQSATVDLIIKDVDGAKVGDTYEKLYSMKVGGTTAVYSHFSASKEDAANPRRQPYLIEWKVRNLKY